MKIDKGFIIIAIVALGFMYLVDNVVGTIEEDNPGIMTENSKRAKELSEYYRVDYDGDPILDLTRVGVEQGKTIWLESPLEQEVMGYFPDFVSMSQIVKNQITDSPFKEFLIDKLRYIEASYTSGSISLDQARDAMKHLD